MRIGELAARSGIAIDTLRYYEKEQLINSYAREINGYRQYDERAFQHLQFIQQAKALGFSLQECRQLLSIFIQRDNYTCKQVKNLAQKKLELLQTKIQQLQFMNNALQRIADACCGSQNSAADCAILNGLDSGKIKKERHKKQV